MLVDVDALNQAEHKSWVFAGVSCLKPKYKRCLVDLSDGGADTHVTREYDTDKLAFVKNGFTLPAAKAEAQFRNDNTLFVGTDFGPGSMSRSGYPRQCRLWKRGTPLASAKLVFASKESDLGASCFHDNTPGFERDFVTRNIEDFKTETFLLGRDGSLALLDLPEDVDFEARREWLLIQTRSPWTISGTTYQPGSLLATKLDEWQAGKRNVTLLFAPTPTTSLSSFSWTQHHLILNELDDVVSRVEVLTPAAGEWTREPLSGAPTLADASAIGADPNNSDEYFMYVSGYLTPPSLLRGVLGQGPPQEIKHSPAFFDATRFVVTREFAKSKDGTRVPYFVIAPKDSPRDGKRPTILYGYGGFEISLTPHYGGDVGRAWLEAGGVYVVANIRGGGEYGPKWHQAAIKSNRLRAYEDFAAVAQALVTEKITSPAHLGVHGGSNGGLLAGNMLTLYPQLFGAVVSEVPLLDMKRYTHLSAGASWMGEYGDPDNANDWLYIKTFSPYQNASKTTKYPPSLFTTSTRDDRVGPAHARKMAARLKELGQDVAFYENIEGGHNEATDNDARAFMTALAYTFLWEHLK